MKCAEGRECEQHEADTERCQKQKIMVVANTRIMLLLFCCQLLSRSCGCCCWLRPHHNHLNKKSDWWVPRQRWWSRSSTIRIQRQERKNIQRHLIVKSEWNGRRRSWNGRKVQEQEEKKNEKETKKWRRGLTNDEVVRSICIDSRSSSSGFVIVLTGGSIMFSSSTREAAAVDGNGTHMMDCCFNWTGFDLLLLLYLATLERYFID